MSILCANFQILSQQSLLVESGKDVPQLPTSLPREELFSNSISTVRLLSSCTAERNLKSGSCIHANVMKSGLQSNAFVSNSLLHMYSKCGQIEDAAQLFEQMPERTIVSWTSMISGFCQIGAVTEAVSIFWHMLESVHPNEHTLSVLLQACAQRGDPNMAQVIHGYAVKYGFITDQFLHNSLLDAYSKSRSLAAAVRLIKKSSCRDVVSWTSVISGCVINGLTWEALTFFFQMQEDGIIPNKITILSVLHACSLINEWRLFQCIHGFIMKLELFNDALVANSLVEMYSVNRCCLEGVKIFCEFGFTGEGKYLSPETMANLLQGCGDSGLLELGEQIHGYLFKHGFFPCTIIENSLINMYGENLRDDSAYQLFRAMSSPDIVSWNTMITNLVKNERSYEALKLLSEIHSKGESDMIFPDHVTMLSSIQASSNLASMQMGLVIHGYTTRAGLVDDIFIQNALIDMYGKLGRIDLAENVFKEIPEKDLGSWNSMIAAFGINGDGVSALCTFTELNKVGMCQPNAISFVSVLSACAHAGLVDEGLEIFSCMERVYSVEPRMEHFGCVVDLLGRSGRLEEAEAFVRRMPLSPGPAVWGALLGACGVFGNVEIAETAAEKLSILEPDGKVWRVTLANVYARVGRWKDAAKVRAEMRGSEGLQKEGGWSSVEVRGEMFRFMVGDTGHPESKMIYKVVDGIQKHIGADQMLWLCRNGE
ncbi:pentatricopeptide repeat-containing protein At3g57430, chloroplastic-like [Malania oleifera]|uniref:pentatricopeptide repeat-containing protein At3g57430, chloroplastic-like n=1 Tax=Malania oleifera TaxID=397392 RepID=UPI0025AD9D7C|nr:pentatricopeptide repeat-containing protein At3g57430, chloroplastic-like [Malania oleifera]